jgi:hypothetical protein
MGVRLQIVVVIENGGKADNTRPEKPLQSDDGYALTARSYSPHPRESFQIVKSGVVDGKPKKASSVSKSEQDCRSRWVRLRSDFFHDSKRTVPQLQFPRDNVFGGRLNSFNCKGPFQMPSLDAQGVFSPQRELSTH